MHFKILCIFLLIKTLKINARAGRILIPRKEQSAIRNTTEKIDLPRGFIPEPSPVNPLLYPFVTAQPARTIKGSTSGWIPIITKQTTTMSPVIRRPLMVQPPKAVSQEYLEHHRRTNSPVYGLWPERPIQTELSQPKLSKIENDKTINNATTPAYKNVIRRRLGGFIEEMEQKGYIRDSSEKNASTESDEQTGNSSKRLHKKQGRRKILNFNENKSNDTHNHRIVDSMEDVKVNSSFPELLNISKQINESLESPKIIKNISIEESFAPKLRNSNSQVPKEWPIDFMAPNGDSLAEDNNSSQHNFHNIFEENTEKPRPSVNLNLDELFGPTTSFNITKMGIPYEDQNSSEEPIICVPLSVREHAISNPNEIVDVERVYCFPLPAASETDQVNQNETLTLNKDAHFNVLNYEELSVSSRGVNVKGIYVISLISFSFFLV